MTDRELLERAAKAADMGPTAWCEPTYNIAGEPESGLIQHSGLWDYSDNRRPWNPLEDDGDAFRLAVTLKLEVYPNWDNKHCLVENGPGEYFKEEIRSDAIAATRRAIVRAAAAMAEESK